MFFTDPVRFGPWSSDQSSVNKAREHCRLCHLKSILVEIYCENGTIKKSEESAVMTLGFPSRPYVFFNCLVIIVYLTSDGEHGEVLVIC